MATFEKRGPGLWRARVRRRGFPTASKNFKSKAEAQAWARDVEGEIDRGSYQGKAEADRTTLLEALDRYENEVTPHKKGSRVEKYRLALWRRDPLASRSLGSLRSADFAKWRDSMVTEGFSASKIRNDLNLISHLFNIARVEWGFEGLSNPITRIRKPKMPEGRDRRLTTEEEIALLAACKNSRSHWLLAVVQVAIETGMRLGEILSLRHSNIDVWEEGGVYRGVARLDDTKNGTRRDVPLSPAAVQALKGVPIDINGKVFPISPESIKKSFGRAVKVAKLTDLRFHDLRHEATSRFFEQGLDIMSVAAITGHKTLAMLQRYTHLRARDIAAKLALNSTAST